MAEPALPKPPAAVFLRDFVDIEVPLDKARQGLIGDGNRLVPMARRATDDGEGVLRLGPSSGGHHIGVPVRVRLGDPIQHPTSVAVPIRWEATALSGLFPVLDGDLDLFALGPGACRLGLSASYRAPLGAVGAWLDRTLLHLVAESTVRSFLHQLAGLLEAVK